MKIKFAILAMTGLALVAGCNRGATTNNSANSSATNNSAAAAPAAPAATAAGTAAVDRTFVTGTWGNGGDCSRTLSFNADGTATNSSDPEVARWALEGETLTITPPNQAPQPGRVTRSGANLVMYGPGGQTVTLTPCTAAAAAAPAANEAAEKEEEAE